MLLPSQKTFDFDFQPESYWPFEDPAAGTATNEVARRLQQAVKQGNKKKLKLPPMPFGLMGGDYLPKRTRHEVEIARIALASTTCDVISILARPTKGRIRYRIVDEYQSRYLISPQSSRRPLTFGQIVRLINTAENIGEAYADRADNPESGDPLAPVDDLRRRTIEENWSDEDILDHADFYTISSDFYPLLEDYYDDQIRQWLVETLGYDPCFELPSGECWGHIECGPAGMAGLSVRCDIWENRLGMWIDRPGGNAVLIWNPSGWDDDGRIVACGEDENSVCWELYLE